MKFTILKYQFQNIFFYHQWYAYYQLKSTVLDRFEQHRLPKLYSAYLFTVAQGSSVIV